MHAFIELQSRSCTEFLQGFSTPGMQCAPDRYPVNLRIIQINHDDKNDATVSSSKFAVFKSMISHRTFGLHSNLDFLSMFYIRGSCFEPKVNINNGDRRRTQVPSATLPHWLGNGDFPKGVGGVTEETTQMNQFYPTV